MPTRSSVGGYPVDHAVIAGRDLEPLREAFEALGLTPEYGGAHAHDVTHNALLGFDDGSYVELISTVEPGAVPAKRAPFIGGDAGPCGWAVEADDVGDLVAAMADRGIEAERSEKHTRETPDGTVVEWWLGYLGSGEPGTELPFAIEDVTPRERRIAPSPSVAGSELTGVGAVVVAAADLDALVDRYRRAFDLPAPEREAASEFGADLARFPGSAAILAAPRDGSWLDARVAEFGTLPCATLLATTDVEAARARVDGAGTGRWFGDRVGWLLDADAVGGPLGVIEA